MNITLFGGSFNPPHIGHQLVMTQVFELIPHLKEIWLLPDYQHSFPSKSSLAPVKHRLAMTKLLENHRINTQTCVIDKQMSGNTIDHLTYLKKKHPQHQFSFLMGSDNLATFTQWPQWQQLLTLMPFYIYPRVGFPLKPLKKNMHPLKHPLQIITNISSTMVRNRLKANLTIKHLVPQPVAQYIKTHQLYP
jgi:nicotinate-nucleotide adenylyltransferase